MPTPSLTDGLLPNTLRQVFDPAVPALFSPGTDVIKQSVAMFYGDTPFPDVINLRKLGLGPAGTLNEGRSTAWTRCSGVAATRGSQT